MDASVLPTTKDKKKGAENPLTPRLSPSPIGGFLKDDVTLAAAPKETLEEITLASLNSESNRNFLILDVKASAETAARGIEKRLVIIFLG